MQEVWTPDGRIPSEVHLRLYLMVLLRRRFLLATNMLDLTTVLLGKTKQLRDARPGLLENRMDPNGFHVPEGCQQVLAQGSCSSEGRFWMF